MIAGVLNRTGGTYTCVRREPQASNLGRRYASRRTELPPLDDDGGEDDAEHGFIVGDAFVVVRTNFLPPKLVRKFEGAFFLSVALSFLARVVSRQKPASTSFTALLCLMRL